MRLPAAPLLGGLIGADLVVAGLTWMGSEMAGRDGLKAAIAVLLVASPLAILVARHAPLSVSRWMGRRDGITYVGSSADRALPRLRQLVIEVDHVVTTGHLTVMDVVPLDVRHMHDLRWFAGALAHGSREQDPVARAIAKLAGPGRPTDVSHGPAHELKGSVDRHPVRFGAHGLNGEAGEVGTTVRVDVDLRPMGHITVAEEVRKTAARCLTTLRDGGVEPILVSPSLSAPDLARISKDVGVEQFHTGVDAATIAATLRPSTTGILRAVASSDPDGDSGVACETILPREAGEDTVVRSASSSIDAALGCVQHVRRLRRSRRIALGCAAAAIILAVPVAAAGLLTPAVAALVAGVTILLVAVVASSTVLLSAPAPATD